MLTTENIIHFYAHKIAEANLSKNIPALVLLSVLITRDDRITNDIRRDLLLTIKKPA